MYICVCVRACVDMRMGKNKVEDVDVVGVGNKKRRERETRADLVSLSKAARTRAYKDTYRPSSSGESSLPRHRTPHGLLLGPPSLQREKRGGREGTTRQRIIP